MALKHDHEFFTSLYHPIKPPDRAYALHCEYEFTYLAT